MPSLTIKGSKKYISYLSKHLIKEHPSTKKRMSVHTPLSEKVLKMPMDRKKYMKKSTAKKARRKGEITVPYKVKGGKMYYQNRKVKR